MLTPIPIIVGPTAGGKSSLAVRVALRLRDVHAVEAEVLAADSMQVYRGMDIGTAKPTLDERAGVAHRLIDLVDPADSFGVDRWLAEAERAIGLARSAGRVPIVVGGTHFYVKALLEGLFDGPSSDERVRAELAAMPGAERWEELKRIDPATAERVHANDSRRVIRAIEVYRLTGRPLSAHQGQWDRGERRAGCFLVGLNWETSAINRRINARVRAMIEAGLVDEAFGLWVSGAVGRQAREALGYKQLFAAFARGAEPCREGEGGGVSPAIEEAIERIKIETRRFAKNQRTWLRRLRAGGGMGRARGDGRVGEISCDGEMTPGDRWFDAEASTFDEIAQAVSEQCLAAMSR